MSATANPSREPIPALDEAEVEQWVGQTSYSRGYPYFQKGAVQSPRRVGSTLRASVQGSAVMPYRVEATFEGEELVDASCSCPVGGGGGCKHVAALLLTWVHAPESFREVPPLDQALESRSKEELIALIRMMIRRDPDLELLLDLPLPGSANAGQALDPERFRKQAVAAFHQPGNEWESLPETVDQLGAMLELGDQFAEQHQPEAALAVYEGVARAVLGGYDEYSDEEGDLGAVLTDCCVGVGQLLDSIQAPETRARIFRVLLEVVELDARRGGVGLSDAAWELLGGAPTAEERREIAAWTRGLIAQTRSDWARKSLGGLLLDLERDELDDESFLQVCRETERTGDLIDRLLALGRVDEARAETERLQPYALLQYASIWISHGHDAEVEAMVRERLPSERRPGSYSRQFHDWLRARLEARGDREASLELTLELFQVYPDRHRYREVRERAVPLGRWSELRPELLRRLDTPEHGALLLEIYLEEGEVALAREYYRSGKRPKWGWGSSAELNLAQALEKDHPDEALRIYAAHAERLIQNRSRQDYAAAAGYLRKVRELFKALGDLTGWTHYIAKVRETHRTLRALKEELERAGL